MSDNMFRWEKDGDNVVTLTMDDPGGSANTLNDTFIHDREKTLHRPAQGPGRPQMVMRRMGRGQALKPVSASAKMPA